MTRPSLYLDTMTHDLQAVIFDFDGLICDTETAAYDAWAAIFREHGAVLQRETWRVCVGAAESPFDPVSHLQELTGRHDLDRKLVMADKERRKAEVSHKLDALPGVFECLEEAKRLGIPIGLASSSYADWVHAHLQRLNLRSYFKVIRTRDDVVQAKPAPDLPLSAAAGLGVPAAACLVLEDSLNGLRAAKAAGARCIVVPNPVTIGSDFAQADAVLGSMRELNLAALFAQAGALPRLNLK